MERKEKKQIVFKIIEQILKETLRYTGFSLSNFSFSLNFSEQEHLDDLWEEINSVFDIDFNFDEANTIDGYKLVELVGKKWKGKKLGENVSINLQWIPNDFLGEKKYKNWKPWNLTDWNTSDKSEIKEIKTERPVKKPATKKETFVLKFNEPEELKNRFDDIKKAHWIEIDFTDSKLDEFPEYICKIKNLRKLNLSKNLIYQVPKSIRRLKNLQILNLSDTQITELPESIGKLTNLKAIFLTDSNIQNLPESIGNLDKLEVIDLTRTQIETIPESITNLVNLKKLILWATPLKKLPQNIGCLTSLEILDLTVTQIKELPKSIGDLKFLKKLYLAYNQIELLPSSVRYLVSLQTLDLEGSSVKKLPASLKKLKNLKTIKLRGTKVKKVNKT